MAFKGGKYIVPKNPKHIKDNLSFSKEEIGILLQLIKASNFSGDMVENIYNIVYKLQLKYNNEK